MHLLSILLGCSLEVLHSAAAQPNILFLMADQHRFDAMGDGAHTPNMDALAATGAKFSTHYSSTPSCTPARAAILTGRSPWRHGMLGYGDVAAKYPSELPAKMVALGLRAAVIGKDHFGWNSSCDAPVSHGFEHLQIYDGLGNGFANGSEYDHYDRWFQQQRPGQNPLKSGGLGWNDWAGAAYEYDEYLHPTAWTGRAAVAAVQELSQGDRPFFLKVSFHRPHSPYDPPERLLNATPSPQKPPAKAVDGWDEKFRDCSMRKQHDTCCGAVDDRSLDLTRRAYLANVAFVDEQIGLIMDALRASGAINNTLIIYTSDHGDMRMDHYLWRKTWPYEGSAHVPFILNWPLSLDWKFGSQRGVKVRAVTELRDLFPTILDAVGHWDEAAEKEFDGRPVTQLLQGKVSGWRSWIDLEHSVYCRPDNHWNALTDGSVKFIYHAYTGTVQLFNLTEDPHEERDLARDASLSDEVKTWRKRMVEQFEAEGRGPLWVRSGHLVQRRVPCTYSPHYPGKHRFPHIPCVKPLESEFDSIVV